MTTLLCSVPKNLPGKHQPGATDLLHIYFQMAGGGGGNKKAGGHRISFMKNGGRG